MEGDLPGDGSTVLKAVGAERPGFRLCPPSARIYFVLTLF